jgi:hypothetical protein
MPDIKNMFCGCKTTDRCYGEGNPYVDLGTDRTTIIRVFCRKVANFWINGNPVHWTNEEDKDT